MRLNHVVRATLAVVACAVVLAFAPATGGGENTDGCKSVAAFVSTAVPELQKDGCSGCHAGSNATATGALDLSSLGRDNAAACAQALNKVDLTNKLESPLIQAPAGTQTHMGGKVADTQGFTAALLGWINNE
jgi:hypothetical protein